VSTKYGWPERLGGFDREETVMEEGEFRPLTAWDVEYSGPGYSSLNIWQEGPGWYVLGPIPGPGGLDQRPTFARTKSDAMKLARKMARRKRT